MSAPERPSAEEITRRLRDDARRWLTAVWAGALLVLLSVGVIGGICVDEHVMELRDLWPLLFVTGCVSIMVAAIVSGAIYGPLGQRIAESLLLAGHHQAAVRALKALPPSDHNDWSVAEAYDGLGAHELALETYRAYVATHAKGRWVIEARVRIAALERTLANPVKPAPQVQAEPTREPSQASHCPFCKDALPEDAPTAECAACGTPHHLACYEEQGGCAVYGCKSHKARARVRE